MSGVRQHTSRTEGATQTLNGDQGLAGEIAANLPWICPPADVLTRLASEPFPLDHLSLEPTIVLLAARFVRPTANPQQFRLTSLAESIVADGAGRLLETHTKFWLRATPFTDQLLARSRDLATRCREATGTDSAFVVGLLANLGWLAMATVDAELAEKTWNECAESTSPATIQRKHWKYTHEEIARRLCDRWKMPTWLAVTLTTLSQSEADAVRLGADPELTRILREDLPLPPGRGRAGVGGHDTPARDPRSVELLPQLLRAAARGRRRESESRLRRAEADIDQLRELLAETRVQFEESVRDAKLASLGELAAGAGHEINNPLAVIVGNAQRLAKSEGDADRKKLLDLIHRQSLRISDIIRDLMYFARPAKPNPARTNAVEVVQEAVGEYSHFPNAKVISFDANLPGEPAWLTVDRGQFRKSIDQLLRNAVEASPDGGNVRIEMTSSEGRFRLAVEDTGPGPRPEAIPHLFDPFFSGRTAGRGRGLGLSIAWRFTEINGGELQYCPSAEGITRFELTFPLADSSAHPQRKSA